LLLAMTDTVLCKRDNKGEALDLCNIKCQKLPILIST